MTERKRYPSDLSDGRWAVVGPFLNAWKIVNALFYQNRTGCQWAYLPHDLPPKSATYHFGLWRDDGTDQVIHDLLRCQAREQAGRAEDPSAKRWVVEQTNGTMMLHRRLTREYEPAESSVSRTLWASTANLVRRLTGTSTPPGYIALGRRLARADCGYLPRGVAGFNPFTHVRITGVDVTLATEGGGGDGF